MKELTTVLDVRFCFIKGFVLEQFLVCSKVAWKGQTVPTFPPHIPSPFSLKNIPPEWDTLLTTNEATLRDTFSPQIHCVEPSLCVSYSRGWDECMVMSLSL